MKKEIYIIAEIGINHNGDMNLCHEMIRQASISGANLVKFQLYDPKEIFKYEPHLIKEGLRCSIKKDDFYRIIDWSREGEKRLGREVPELIRNDFC